MFSSTATRRHRRRARHRVAFSTQQRDAIPREYASDLSHVEGAKGDFSFELARIGYLSLYDSERRRLGPWPIAMVVEMQTCLLDLQIELLIGTPTFGPMVRNAQVVAEERLFELIEDSRSLLTVSAALTARAVIRSSPSVVIQWRPALRANIRRYA